MIKPDQIPDEVVEVARDAISIVNYPESYVRSAIAAAINAWPGAEIEEGGLYWRDEGPIVLPLTQEKNDD